MNTPQRTFTGPVRSLRPLALFGLLLAPAASALAAPDLTGYTLSFSDEFTTMSIAAPSANPTTNWTSKPAHGSGFGSASFANQNQYASGHPFSIVNGALRITCRKINGAWRSGLISSVCRTSENPEGVGFSQAMGYWEARMKFPAGSGVWPGFWLLGMGRLKTPREQVAEIDIVEYYCQPIDQFSEVLHIWSPTGVKLNGQQYNHAIGSGLTTGFHTYGVLIKDDFISYYWDGILKWQIPTPPEAKKPMWCMAEYAIGAGWPIDEAAIDNSYTDIDYIRVYAPPATATLPIGTFKITAKHSGKCLDGRATDPIKQYTYTGSDHQKWTTADVGGGQYSIREVATTRAAYVYAGSTADGARVAIWNWGGFTRQLWTGQPASSGYFRLINVNSGKAMEVAGSSTADGANVQQWSAGTGSNQEFAFEAITPPAIPIGTFKIVAKHSGKCLDGRATDPVKQYTYTGTDHQKWTTADIGGGQYSIREVATTRAAYVYAGSTADGARVAIWNWGGFTRQLWTGQPASSGYFRLINVNSGKAMEVAGSSTADGANVQQWSAGTGSNQEFAFLAP